MDYKSPYLLLPQYNATNGFMINYYGHNQTSDAWEVAFQYPGNKSGVIYGIAGSSDNKYVSVIGAFSTVNKGNVSAGYSQINSYSHTAVRGEFTPNNKFFFITNFNFSTSVYINCNWNTSGDYFYNSTSGACEQCVGCLDCDSGGVCVSCDEANNYFMDTGICILCNLTNCATCSSLTTCSACDSGYEVDNSTCVALPSSGDTTEQAEDPVLSTGQIAGIVVGSTAFVGLTFAASKYVLN